MYKWLAYPMVRASIVFILGIYFGLEANINSGKLEVLCVGVYGIYWLTLKTGRSVLSIWHPGLAALAMFLFVLAGLLRAHQNRYMSDPVMARADFYLATVVVPGQPNGNYLKTTLAATRVWSSGIEYTTNDRIQWYQVLQKSIKPDYGSQVILKGAPTLIQSPQNPQEFDYAGFMSRKNVFWHHWADQDQVLKRLPAPNNSITGLVYRFRDHLKDKLTAFLPAGVSREISAAMLLGDRASVSGNLEDSFARSGTIHVLAVSGLHLGILYWMLLQVLGKWRRHILLKWIFVVVCLGILWMFTLITGMAPSTQRAATMFSVLILANNLSRQNHTGNNLATSAMVILWLDPYQLYSVGFQLSFLALGGILYLQPCIAGWWSIKNRILKYFWELTTVSLAAQLAVLPLSAYYFHQLPVYFLVSNLLLIPLAFAIVFAGILFFVSTAVPFLSVMIAKPLIYLTRMAGFIVQSISDMPFSTLQGIQLSDFELVIWYGILLSSVIFLKTRNRLAWALLLSFLVGITSTKLFDVFRTNQLKQIVVYHVPGHTAIDFIDRGYYTSVMDTVLASDQAKVNYKISNYHRYLGLRPVQNPMLTLDHKSPADLWMFKGKRLLLIKAAIDYEIGKKDKLKSDIVVVSNNSVKNLEHFLAGVKVELLIIDGSNRKGRARILEQQAMQMGLTVHNCWEDGFKIINM